MLADVEPAAGGERVVGLAAEFDLGHVAQVDDLPGPAGLHDDALELLRVGQPAERGDGELEPLARTGSGGWPTCPAATCTFCRRRAAITSSVVSWRAASLSGSSQMRIAYAPDAADHHVADAVHAAQFVAQLERGVVRQEQPVVRAGQRVHAGHVRERDRGRSPAGRQRQRAAACRPRPGRCRRSRRAR